MPRVVIVGGGFAGLNAARGLRGAPVDLTLVDRQNHHLFQPLLYQVATGGLSPADIASPIRYLLRRQRNCSTILAEVLDIDPARRRVILADRELPYDFLVLATGARTSYFGHEDWVGEAPGLKSLEDAREIRARVLLAFEGAELEEDPISRTALLTFVVVGGGPTGVELAGAIAELARETLRRDFRAIDTGAARILLVEGGERILPTFSARLSTRAQGSLESLGVEVWSKAIVTRVEGGHLEIDRGGVTTRVEARTTLWAAGVTASPLGRKLAERTGARVDRGGRVVVEPDCSLAGHPEVFVLGDLASFAHGLERPLPGVAPVALQQGRYVARRILAQVRGSDHPPFRYHHRGDLATIGRSRAVAKIGRLELGGLLAWLTWTFVHLLYLVEFQNRVLVMIQWAWSYFTWNRSARLIPWKEATEEEDGP